VVSLHYARLLAGGSVLLCPAERLIKITTRIYLHTCVQVYRFTYVHVGLTCNQVGAENNSLAYRVFLTPMALGGYLGTLDPSKCLKVPVMAFQALKNPAGVRGVVLVQGGALCWLSLGLLVVSINRLTLAKYPFPACRYSLDGLDVILKVV
jgi:hypothetical protein